MQERWYPAALGLHDQAAIEPGATVLVEAASGGVGSLLVQLAKRAGACVVGAAGGDHKLELARSLGADVVVDYRRNSWTDEVASLHPVIGPEVPLAHAPRRPSGD